MRQLFVYLKPYIKYVILAPIGMFLEVLCELMMPKLMTGIINYGVAAKDFQYIGKTGALMIFFAILGILGGIGCLIAASKASQGFGTDVRYAMFQKIQEFSFGDIDKFKTSSLITRLTNDITQVQMVVLMSLRLLIRAPLLFIGGIVMAFTINAELA